jgi:hypothetical protein
MPEGQCVCEAPSTIGLTVESYLMIAGASAVKDPVVLKKAITVVGVKRGRSARSLSHFWVSFKLFVN